MKQSKTIKKGMAILLVVAMLFSILPAGAVWADTETDVAVVTEADGTSQYFTSFANALNAAKKSTTTGSTIKLLRDVTIEHTDDVDSQNIRQGNFILDLNGCTVYAASDIAGFNVSNEGTVLTITDTSASQEGKITITPFAEGIAAPPVSISSGASVILEAGTLAGNVGVLLYADGGSFIMNGGKIDATEAMFIHGGTAFLNVGEIKSINNAISMSGAPGANVTIGEDVTITAELGNTISYASGSLDLKSANCNEWTIMNYMDSDTMDLGTPDIQYPKGYSLQDAAGNKIELTFDSSATLRNHEAHNFGDEHKCTVFDCSAVEPHAWKDNGICACGVSADMRITDSTGSVSYAMAEDLYDDELYTNVTVDIMHGINLMVLILGKDITVKLNDHCIDGSADSYGGMSVYDIMGGTSQIVGSGVIKGGSMGTLDLMGNVTVGAGVELVTPDGVPDIIVYENTIVDLSESSCGGWIIEYYPMSSDPAPFNANNIILPTGHSLLDGSGGTITEIAANATATVSQCVAQENSHACTCGKVLSECADEGDDNICDVCGKNLCTHTDDDGDLICDSCDVMLGECENWQNHSWDTNADGNVVCDICGKYADLKITETDGEISYATAREVFALTEVAYPNAYADVTIDVLRDIEAGLWISASGSTVNLNGYTVTGLDLQDHMGSGINTISGSGIVNTSQDVFRAIGITGDTVIDNVTIETNPDYNAILVWESLAENTALTIRNCDCEGWKIENSSVENMSLTVTLPDYYVLDTDNNTIEADSKATIQDGRQTPTVTAPVANTLTYNGSEQALVTAGSAEGGTMYYSTDEETWSTDIPAGKAAGDYTVYYKVLGNDGYKDIAAQSIAVTIAPKALTVSEVAANDKTCDGTDDVEITSVTLNGIMSGDDISVAVANVTGSVSGTAAGTYNVVNLSNLSLTGDDSANYTIASEAANVPLNQAVTIAHSCSDEWVSDGENHWHECTGCDEQVDKAAHIDETEIDHECDICETEISLCADMDGDGNHDCDVCNAKDVTEHRYSDATCTTPATCTECGATSGEALGHSYGDEWKSDGTSHWHECTCGEKADEAAHIDETEKDHKCDICGATVGTHAAADGKHTCDYCGETVTQCADTNPKDHKCDVCGETISECVDENNNDICDICEKPMLYVGGVGLEVGKYIDNNGNISAVQPSGGYAYYKDGTLYLHNYVYSGQGSHEQMYNLYAVIYALKDITVEVSGINQLTSTAGKDGEAIAVVGNMTIDGNGDGVLIVQGGYGISAMNNITIDAVKALQITATDYDGIYAEEGNVTIIDSEVTIKAARDGIYTLEGDVIVDSTAVSMDADGVITGTSLDITANTADGNGCAIIANKDAGETVSIAIDEALTIIQPENGKVVRGTFTPSTPDYAPYVYAVIADENEEPVTRAVIAPLQYKVTFRAENGTFTFPVLPGQSLTDIYGAEYLDVFEASMERDGYTFGGWYSDEALTQAYAFTDTVNADITLYPKWTENSTSGDDGGTPSAPSYSGGSYTPPSKAEVALPDSAGDDVKVEAENITTSTLNDVKDIVADDDNLALIGGKDSAVQITAEEDGEALESFDAPISITVPVSKSDIKNVTDTGNLTLALVTEDTHGNSKLTYVGGSYDADKGTFTAYTNMPGSYVLVEKDDLIKIVLTIDSTIAMVNDEPVVKDVPSRIVNGRTLVPAAFVLYYMDCDVVWMGDTRTVVVTLPNDERLSMPIDTPIPGFGTQPMIENGRTLVPVAYVADMMDCHVLWVGDARQVIIVK